MTVQENQILNTYFGYTTFRAGQKETIDQVMQSFNTLAVMPTGGGKSLCYQIPGLALDGTAIIISPLISLMKDQVDALQTLGIAATYINSSLTAYQQENRLRNMQNGHYSFVYVAPERFESNIFIRYVQSTTLSLIAFDEAHCISQWGHDFRPSYRSIVPNLKKLSNLPVIMALTATATVEVIRDICSLLHIADQHVINTGFERKNLAFHIVKGKDKMSYVRSFMEAHPDESGIIYTATRKQVDTLHAELEKRGYEVGKYHAGLPEEDRKEAQSTFIRDEKQVMIATNAFGMGIDKSNIRFVIHYAMPMSLEAYYQEAGRAGRDGEPSDCILLFSPQDIQMQKFLISQSTMQDDAREQEYRKLQAMINYCHTHGCLNAQILDYFSNGKTDHLCNRCSNCLHRQEKVDMTKEAQMILSCVRRMGERFGTSMTAKVLKGSNDKKIKNFHLHTLSTYGILSDYTEKELTEWINFLIAEEKLTIEGGKFPILKLNHNSALLLKGKQEVWMYTAPLPVSETADFNEDLFRVLRSLRKDIADRQNVPPYVLFSDATLKDMCRYLPETKADMLQIKGVGEKRFDKYGETFLDSIKSWKSAHPEAKAPIKIGPAAKPSREPLPGKAADERPSHLISYQMFQEGRSLSTIADIRGIAQQTVANHIFKAFKDGSPVSWEVFFNAEEEIVILTAHDALEENKLKPLKESLPEDYDYDTIKAVLIKNGRM